MTNIFRFVCISLAAAIAFSPGPASAADPCATLDACMKKLISAGKALDGSVGLDVEDLQLAERVASFDGAAERLVLLLADPNIDVARLASDALSHAQRIDPIYLPKILAGLDRGLRGLPPALCAVPGDAPAREAVARYLVSDSAPHNQEVVAVRRCGLRALPHIIERARCGNDCTDRDHYLLGAALEKMSPDVRLAAGRELIKLLNAADLPESTATGMLSMISSLGDAGKPLAPELRALRTRREDLVHMVDVALLGIGADEGGAIYARRLADLEPGMHAQMVLRDLAELGPAGRDAGEAVVRLMKSEDRSTRIAAARTSGYLEYRPAGALLAHMLNAPDDVNLSWVAAEALGRLRDPQSVAPLQRAAKEHWYPAVRSAALEAIEHIEKRTPYERGTHGDTFAFDYLRYSKSRTGIVACAAPLVASIQEPRAQKLQAYRDESKLAALKYNAVVHSTGLDGAHHEPISQVPGVGLRVRDGWLLGGNRGEWGGELVFLDDDKRQQTILEINIEDIYVLGSRFVAVAGLAHLSFNDGVVYELTREAGGKWVASPWRGLPGAPMSSTLVDTGELLIDTYEGGTILIAPDGAMRIAPCGQAAGPAASD